MASLSPSQTLLMCTMFYLLEFSNIYSLQPSPFLFSLCFFVAQKKNPSIVILGDFGRKHKQTQVANQEPACLILTSPEFCYQSINIGYFQFSANESEFPQVVPFWRLLQWLLYTESRCEGQLNSIYLLEKGEEVSASLSGDASVDLRMQKASA